MPTTGENIRYLRLKKGMTQKELGEKSGIAAPNIRKYETNRQNPKLETLEKIALALGVSYVSLLGSTENHTFEEKLYREMQYETMNIIDEMNYKLVPIGYILKEDIQEGYLWIECPDDTTFEVSIDDVTKLNNEIDSFAKFKIEEIRFRNKTN